MKKRDLQVVFTITGGWQAMKPRSGVIGYRGSAPLEGGWIDENCSSTMWNPTRHEGLLELNAGITSIGGGQSADYSPFYNMASVTGIDLSESTIRNIGDYAFYGCTGLESIEIPKRVTEIGDSAFGGCTNLLSVTCLAEEPPTLGSGNFSADAILYVPADSVAAYRADDDWSGSFLRIYPIGYVQHTITYNAESELTGEWVTTHTDTELNEYDSVTGDGILYLNADVSYITGLAFANNTDLISIDLSDSGITEIRVGAFQNCTALTTVVIPDGVTSIDYYAFYGCSSLTSVNIPSGVTEIYGETFTGCYSLASITIPNSVTTIGSHAFFGCESLTSVTIPNSVTTIDSAAFANCALTSVTIGSGVTSIDNYAFIGYNILASVTCLAAVPPALGRNVFGTDEECTLYVPMDSYEAYTGDADWSSVFTSIRPIGYTYITVSAGEHGTAGGSGWYQVDAYVVLTATADEHYHFTQWNDGNTSNPRAIIVGSTDTTYTASFAVDEYTLVLTGDAHTTVTGYGTYAYGTQVQITATSDEHYHFVSWSDGNTNATRTITITENMTLGASSAINEYTITVSAGQHGTASGSGTYAYGTSVQISATADTDYHFTQWNDGNTDNPRTIVVTGNATYTASFESDAFTVTITGDAHTTVTGSGSYPYGTQVQISATPDEHYHFVAWSDGDTNATRIITVTGNITLSASSAIDTYTITVNAGQHGTASGSGSYPYGTQVQISATADTYYRFTAWNDGNTDNPRTVTVTGNATYTASIEAMRTISYNAPTAVSGTWLDTNTETALNSYDTNTGDGVLYLKGGVTSIGGGSSTDYSPFYNKSDLVSVDLTDSGLTAIDRYAFFACSAMGNITIPNTVTLINSFAFRNCSSMTSLNIPSSVTEIGGSVWVSCSGLASITVDSNNTHYNDGNGSNCIITSGNQLKVGCKNTVIPNTVTSIGEAAFNGMSGLTSITIPSNVASISNYAFNNCSALATVTCEATTPPTLGTNNFGRSADSLYVPYASLSSYQNDSNWRTAFASIRPIGYSYITVSAGQHGSASGTGWYEIGTTATISATADSGYAFTAWNDGNTSNPRSVSVGSTDETYTAAFDVMPAQIRYTSTNQATGDWVTNNTDTTRNTYDSTTHEGVLYLNSGVTTIGGGSNASYTPFKGDTGLTSIDFSDSRLTTLAAYTCNACSNLTTAVIGDSVTSLGGANDTYGVFEGCTSLANVSIGNSVALIGKYAFYQCSALTTLVLPSSVTAITQSATGSCSNLTSVTCNATTPPTLETSNFPASNDVLNVPASSVSAYLNDSTWNAAFNMINDYVKITVTAGANGSASGGGWYEIGTTATITATPNAGYALKQWNDGNTNNPRTITVTGKATYTASFELQSGVIKYNSTAAVSGNWVTNNTNTSQNTYNSSTHVGILYLKSGVTSIGGGQNTNYSPFYNDTKVTSVEFGSQIKTIGSYTCRYCNAMTSVTIPNGVTTIGENAFNGPNLTSLTLPSSVTSIGNYAFNGSSNLKTVTCYATTPPTLGGSYNFTASGDTLKVPSASVSAYKNDAYWKGAFTTITSI